MKHDTLLITIASSSPSSVFSIHLNSDVILLNKVIGKSFPEYDIVEVTGKLEGKQSLMIEWHQVSHVSDDILIVGPCSYKRASDDIDYDYKKDFDYIIFEGGTDNLKWRDGILASLIMYKPSKRILTFDVDNINLWHDYDGEFAFRDMIWWEMERRRSSFKRAGEHPLGGAAQFIG